MKKRAVSKTPLCLVAKQPALTAKVFLLQQNSMFFWCEMPLFFFLRLLTCIFNISLLLSFDIFLGYLVP
jgi:hypothetical protein